MIIKANIDDAICELQQRINMVQHRERLARQIALAEAPFAAGNYGRVQLPPSIDIGEITLSSDDDKEAYDAVLAALKARLARQDEALRLVGIEIDETITVEIVA